MLQEVIKLPNSEELGWITFAMSAGKKLDLPNRCNNIQILRLNASLNDDNAVSSLIRAPKALKEFAFVADKESGMRNLTAARIPMSSGQAKSRIIYEALLAHKDTLEAIEMLVGGRAHRDSKRHQIDEFRSLKAFKELRRVVVSASCLLSTVDAYENAQKSRGSLHFEDLVSLLPSSLKTLRLGSSLRHLGTSHGNDLRIRRAIGVTERATDDHLGSQRLHRMRQLFQNIFESIRRS